MTGRRMWWLLVVPLLVLAVSLIAAREARGAWECGACPATPDASAVRYLLSKASEFEVGCFGPCECPLLTRSGLTGSFLLIPYRTDPLFREYLLCGIDWNIPASGSVPPVHIAGEGWYRVGGEVAAQHELRLCVSVNGGETQPFESGLVSGGGDFPSIDIAAATSGFFCWDSVVTVKAGPATTDVVQDRTAMGLGLSPNPSSGRVDLRVALPRPGRVSLSILDVGGRQVRTLVRGAWLPAGEHLLSWDGTVSDGTRAPAGFYLVRLGADGMAVTQRLIRL